MRRWEPRTWPVILEGHLPPETVDVTPLEIIRQAQADTLVDEDGQAVTLELLPGLSQKELRDFARRVPCRVPQEIVELLSACRGFCGTIEQVDFTGRDLMFEFEAVFPFSDFRSRRTATAISGLWIWAPIR